jgi:hypothetical protein
VGVGAHFEPNGDNASCARLKWIPTKKRQASHSDGNPDQLQKALPRQLPSVFLSPLKDSSQRFDRSSRYARLNTAIIMSAQSRLPTGPTDWSKFREDHPRIRGMKLTVGTGIPGSGSFTDETKRYDFQCLVTTSKNNRTVDWLPPAGFSWNGYPVGRDADEGARKIIDELQLESQPVGELCLTAALRAVQTAESDASTKRPANIEFYKRTRTTTCASTSTIPTSRRGSRRGKASICPSDRRTSDSSPKPLLMPRCTV